MCFIIMGRHKEWRKIAKKMRRKRIRSGIARQQNERDLKAESSPRHQAWLAQQTALEEAMAAEEEVARQRREQEWLAEELRAQQQFRLKQLEKEKHDQQVAKQKEALKAEIAAREKKKKEELEAKEKLKQQEEQLALEREKKIEDFMEQGTELPPELRVASETNPGKPPCPFFSKVAACRFGDTCSRNHIRPSISNCLMFAGMFSHPALGLTATDNQAGDQQDWSLEFAEAELRTVFLDFYQDIVTELGSMADLVRLLVSCNSEPHLRGNVYVQFTNERDALKTCRRLSGRWYAGRRLQPCFVTVPSWRQAICGLQDRRCPKGRNCNFLHVFRNPHRQLMYSSPPVRDHNTREPSSRRRERSRSLSPWSPGRRITEQTPRRSRSPSSWSTRSLRRKSRSPTPRVHRRNPSSRVHRESRSPSNWSTRSSRRRSKSRSLSPWSNNKSSRRKRRDSKSPNMKKSRQTKSKSPSPNGHTKIKPISESRFSSSPEINLTSHHQIKNKSSKRRKRKTSHSKEKK